MKDDNQQSRVVLEPEKKQQIRDAKDRVCPFCGGPMYYHPPTDVFACTMANCPNEVQVTQQEQLYEEEQMEDWLERIEERASLCSMCENTPTYTPEEVGRLIGLYRGEKQKVSKLQAKLDRVTELVEGWENEWQGSVANEGI